MAEKFDGEGFAKEKEEMKILVQDLRLRLRKLKDNPIPQQREPLIQKIHADRERLKKMAKVIGGQVLLDFNNLDMDLEQVLNVPDDKKAFPQLEDDADILLNELNNGCC